LKKKKIPNGFLAEKKPRDGCAVVIGASPLLSRVSGAVGCGRRSARFTTEKPYNSSTVLARPKNTSGRRTCVNAMHASWRRRWRPVARRGGFECHNIISFVRSRRVQIFNVSYTRETGRERERKNYKSSLKLDLAPQCYNIIPGVIRHHDLIAAVLSSMIGFLIFGNFIVETFHADQSTSNAPIFIQTRIYRYFSLYVILLFFFFFCILFEMYLRAYS